MDSIVHLTVILHSNGVFAYKCQKRTRHYFATSNFWGKYIRFHRDNVRMITMIWKSFVMCSTLIVICGFISLTVNLHRHRTSLSTCNLEPDSVWHVLTFDVSSTVQHARAHCWMTFVLQFQQMHVISTAMVLWTNSKQNYTVMEFLSTSVKSERIIIEWEATFEKNPSQRQNVRLIMMIWKRFVICSTYVVICGFVILKISCAISSVHHTSTCRLEPDTFMLACADFDASSTVQYVRWSLLMNCCGLKSLAVWANVWY